jgi:Flp pilus assembly protein TadB
MKFQWPWRKSKKIDVVSLLESKLEAAMQPVQARKDYLEDLRSKLVNQSEKRFLGMRIKSPEFILAIAGGALSVIVLLVTGARAVIALLGTLGILQQVSKQVNENPPSPMSPTS